MTRARRAALLLAGLEPSDRDDVFARLPRDMGERIAPHLDELRALGATPGYDWLALLDTDAVEAAPKETPAAQAVQTLMSADADAVGRALGHEPVTLVAALLSVGDWPWRDRFLAACNGDRRTALAARLQAPVQMTATVRRLLLEQVARRVQETDPAARPVSAFDAALALQENESQGQNGWRPIWAR